MKSLNVLLLSSALFIATGVSSQTTYNYTGSMQTYVVPACVTSVNIASYGAQGANSQDRLTTNAAGGLGAYVTGNLVVTPGETLYIFVGGQGNTNGNGGYNGGGIGGSSAAGGGCFGGPAAGGGGASDVRRNGTTLADRVLVAGGGGGSGRDYCNGTCQPCGCGGSGGGGGNANGVNGNAAYNCGFSYPGGGVNFGSGGSQVSGGAGGPPDGSGNPGTAGTLGVGGNGGAGTYDVAGGGGGGGYYGGGGGGGASSGSGVGGGGGGGGSSYIGGVTGGVMTPANRSGDGMVVITPNIGPPAQPASISGPASICSGSSQTYSISPVSGATSYTWSVPSGTIIVSGQGTTSISITAGSTSGVISVYASNTCGNGPAQNFTLTINPQPTANAGPDTTLCTPNSITLNASGGTSYSWSPASGLSSTTISNPVASPTVTTTYTVTVTNAGGCSATDAITILVNPSPPMTTSANPATVCSGGSAVLTAAGANTYVWMPGNMTGSSITVNPTTTITYTVTGTTTGGCTGTSTVTVNIFAPTIISLTSNPASVCAGGTVTLDASGAISYSWQPGNLTGQQVMVNPTTTTTYTVTGTDANGCTGTATITANIYAAPVVTLASNPALVCSGGSAAMSANGASTYVWQPGNMSGQLVTVNPTATTTYTVTGTDGNGCTGTSTITINVNPLPLITTSSGDSICQGDSMQLAASGGISYVWMPGGQTTATITVNPNSTTTYTVTGTDANGCSATATVTVGVFALPNVTLNLNPSTVCINWAAYALTGGTPPGGSYSGNGVNAGQFNPSVAGAGTTFITYTYTDANGCTNSSTQAIMVSLCSGVDELNKGEVVVFPNPADHSLTISFEGKNEDVIIELMDISGKKVIAQNYRDHSGTELKLDVSQLSPGVYQLTLLSETYLGTAKLIIER